MRLIKLALISAVVLFIVLLLISLLLPSHQRISRAVDISAAPASVRPLIKDLHNWKDWNRFVMAYGHATVKDGHIAADEMTISPTQESDSVLLFDWLQASGKKFGSGFVLIGNDTTLTTVQWYFDFKVSWYPWEKFQSIVYDQQLGPLMQGSLNKLKELAEKK
jgi:hypothetical protein